MKKTLSLLLLLSLLLSVMSSAAFATEGLPEEQPPVETPEETPPTEVSTLAELLSAIEAAEDGDTIIIAQMIYLDGDELSTDKNITLKAAEGMTTSLVYVTKKGGAINGFRFEETEDKRYTIFTASDSEEKNVLQIENCIFDGNGVHGSAFIFNSGFLAIHLYKCSFIHNRDFAIVFGGRNNIVDQCVFTDNLSILSGAAFTSSGSIYVSNSTISGNSSGIYNTGTLTMENCIIYGNTLDTESPFDIRNEGTLNIDTVADGRAFYRQSTGDKIDMPMETYQEPEWLFCFTPEEAQLYFSRFEEPNIPNEPEEPETPPVPVRPARPSRPIHIYVPPVESEKEPEPERFALSHGGATLNTSTPLQLLGYGDGQLREDDPITRAQIAVLLYRALTTESKASLATSTSIFADVSAEDWYYDAVAALSSAGIINGCDGRFNPNDSLTWGQLIALLTRFTEPKTADMPDEIIYAGHWAYDNIVSAVAYGWIDDATSIDPDEYLTRGEAVSFINSVLQK